METTLGAIEDALILVCTAPEPMPKIVITTTPSTFLAFNTVKGYSHVDFVNPDSSKLKELSAILRHLCDLPATERLFAGLFKDMIQTIAPTVSLEFRPSRLPAQRAYSRCVMGAFERNGVSASPRASRSSFLPTIDRMHGTRCACRRPTNGAAARPSLSNPSALTLAAFGDSFTFGKEIDEAEIGRTDKNYREERAFPYLLAKRLGMRYGQNFGMPGSNNRRILRSIYDFVIANRSQITKYFFVVGLTHPQRKSFILKSRHEYLFISRSCVLQPQIIGSLCSDLFSPRDNDDGINVEFEHCYWIISSFLQRLGCKHLIFPAWNFSRSDRYFRNRHLGKEAAFFLGPQERDFGFQPFVYYLPRGGGNHPLSEGHRAFADELARIVRARGLL